METIIEKTSIDQAINELAYRNQQSLKYRLLDAIRARYADSEPAPLKEIPVNELVVLLWDTKGNGRVIANRSKNFSSIKSAVNKDLKKLYKQGKNPDGLIIGPQNFFIMSDEAKEDLLASLAKNASQEGISGLNQFARVMGLLNQMLADPEIIKANGDTNLMEQMKNLMQGLSEQLGAGLGESEKAMEEPGAEDETDILEEVDDELEDADILDEAADNDFEDEEIQEESDDEEIIVEQDGEDLEDTESIDEIADEEFDDKGIGEVEVVVDKFDEDAQGSEIADGIENEIAGDKLDDETQSSEIADEVEDENIDDSEIVDQIEDEAPDDENFLEEVDGEDIDDEDINDDILDEADDEELEDTESIDENIDEVEVVDEEFDDTKLVEADDKELEDEEIEDKELEDTEILEDADDEIENDGLDEGFEEGKGADGPEPSMGTLGAEVSPNEPQPDKAKVLAEEFDGYLGTMEKYYNQYLLIPEGAYIVGAKSPCNGEQPEQKIQIKPFFIGKFPVTTALFEIFVEKTGYVTVAEKKGYGMVYAGQYRKTTDPRTGRAVIIMARTKTCEKIQGACWYQPQGPGSTLHKKRNHPVVQISRRDALAFSAWTGKSLPTESQWEAAARTKDGLIYPWGNKWEEGRSNTEESRFGETCPVDHFENANTLNISDTLGNIMEWTADIFSPHNASQDLFIIKSSSWISNKKKPLFFRTGLKDTETSNLLGFRCVAI